MMRLPGQSTALPAQRVMAGFSQEISSRVLVERSAVNEGGISATVGEPPSPDSDFTAPSTAHSAIGHSPGPRRVARLLAARSGYATDRRRLRLDDIAYIL